MQLVNPGVYPVKPLVNPVEPADKPPKLLVHSIEPATNSAKLLVHTVEPVANSVKPVIDLVKPSVNLPELFPEFLPQLRHLRPETLYSDRLFCQMPFYSSQPGSVILFSYDCNRLLFLGGIILPYVIIADTFLSFNCVAHNKD